LYIQYQKKGPQSKSVVEYVYRRANRSGNSHN